MQDLERTVAVIQEALDFLDSVRRYCTIIANAHNIMQLYQSASGFNGARLTKEVC